MEQKKNNALEKAEQIANKNASEFTFEKEFNGDYETQQILADKRVESAREKQTEKALKQKQKVEKQRQKNKKKAFLLFLNIS